MNICRRTRVLLLTPILLLLPACGDDPEPSSVGSLTLRIAQGRGDEAGRIGAAVSVSRGNDGAPVDLAGANPRLIVEASVDGGAWEALEGVEADYVGPHRLDVMLIADNSGSEATALETMREAIGAFATSLLRRSAEDRLGLVRVSTEARVLEELTSDETAFSAALTGLFVTNGWSALWDGVRLANETLAVAPPVLDAAGGHGERFCADRTYRAIVAFTDGVDNNSADEHDTRYEGDGVDTTFDDLIHLQVEGVATPIHWVGIGDRADGAALEAMADATGARYVAVDQLERLHGALTSAAARLTSQVPICFELESCGHVDLRLTVEFDWEGERHSLTHPRWASADCVCHGTRANCTLRAP